MEYYKKIDKSVFHYGITIPKKHVDSFIFNKHIPVGKGRKLQLKWVKKKKRFEAILWHIQRKEATSVHQIRWDSNYELLLELKKEFIQSYLAIESQNYAAKVVGKYYRTDLLGGNQEVLIFRPIRPNLVEMETFIKIETPYDNIFKRLVEENVFGWLSKTRRGLLRLPRLLAAWKRYCASSMPSISKTSGCSRSRVAASASWNPTEGRRWAMSGRRENRSPASRWRIERWGGRTTCMLRHRPSSGVSRPSSGSPKARRWT